MAADNAITSGLIAAGFATDNRRKIIAWGVAAAFLFRIVLLLELIIYLVLGLGLGSVCFYG